jgi:hypothetical protein
MIIFAIIVHILSPNRQIFSKIFGENILKNNIDPRSLQAVAIASEAKPCHLICRHETGVRDESFFIKFQEIISYVLQLKHKPLLHRSLS